MGLLLIRIENVGNLLEQLKLLDLLLPERYRFYCIGLLRHAPQVD